MSTWNLPAGTVVTTVVSFMGFSFTHVGILTDDRGPDGERMVRSHSRRANGTVLESLTHFAREARSWKSAGYWSRLPASVVLARSAEDARRRIPWSIWRNCEHFVRRWHGLPEESPQLQAALFSSGGVAALVLLLRRMG